MVALRNLFEQQPVLATVRPVLSEHISCQAAVVEALSETPKPYREDVLKLFVQIIESANCEVEPDVWEMYYELKLLDMMRLIHEERTACASNCTYRLSNDQVPVRIAEDRQTLVQSGDTGLRTWESSLAITEYLCTNVSEFTKWTEDRPVIELGCGTGLVSLTIAKLCNPQRVIATDISPRVIAHLEETIEANNVAVEPLLFDWRDSYTASELPRNAFVVATDILYGLTSMYDTIISLLLGLKPAKIVMCNPARNEEAYAQFLEQCSPHFVVHKLAEFAAAELNETEYMFLCSVPPIRLELIELVPL